MNTDRRTFLRRCAAGAIAGGCLQAFPAGEPAPGPPPKPSGRVKFGKTDLYVSRLRQGTAFRKNRRDPDDPNALRVLERCIDIGINFFDSSNAYGWGGSELTLGRAIRGRRSQVVICTKVHPALKP